MQVPWVMRKNPIDFERNRLTPGGSTEGGAFFCFVAYGMCGLIREHIRWAARFSGCLGSATFPPGVAWGNTRVTSMLLGKIVLFMLNWRQF